jgi:hypothetical protein
MAAAGGVDKAPEPEEADVEPGFAS